GMVPSVEEVSSSLVREYLSRKGLKRTIACMDEEHPRTEASINNRSELRQILSIDDLYRKNKLHNNPLKTLLEVITRSRYFTGSVCEALFSTDFTFFSFVIMCLNEYAVLFHRLDITATFPSQATNASLMPANDRKSSNSQTGFWGPDLGVQKDHPAMDSLQDKTSLIQKEPEKNTSETTQRSRTNRIRRGILAGPVPQVLKLLCLKTYVIELKTLLLGSSLNCFNIEWRNQGFTFSDTHDLRYGIVQRKGGPCGVLASVQAFVLKKLLFESTESCTVGLQPSNSIRRKCLVLALAEILWRAGEEKQATVAINSGRNQFIAARPYRSEGVLEKVHVFYIWHKTLSSTFLFICFSPQFEPGMLGCVLLTVSAVLSRSIQKVQEDMDVPTTTLIGAHGYCTQELVNLLLCGRAVSNVFDDDVELDSGNGNMTLLKGVKGHCDVGLLSLFEHYNICKTDLTPPLELCIRTR
uniref:Ubiquitin carboxyl-terminal hydrolase MINDY n=1 Tax=Neolamprologus brichardi TaxID=32507 RepID=A0A3Q4HUL1_NEOBR